MAKEELDKIIKETPITSTPMDGEDPLRSMLTEIYFEGFSDGFLHARDILTSFGPNLLASNVVQYIESNIDNIESRLAAIQKYREE